MTPERINKVVKRLRQIAVTGYSNYAGFHFELNPGEEYNHCFVINDQKFHSSNFTLELENIDDGIKIIQEFTGQSKQNVLKELKNTGFYVDNSPIYLHYLKLLKGCEDK